MSANQIALEMQNVSKSFGHSEWNPFKRGAARKRIVAVNDVSVQVQRSEIFGVLGPNGSGKSTFIRLLSTLLVPDTGQVTIFGHDILREERAVQKLINRVSVEAAFFKKLSPLENLMYGARLYGLGGAEARAKIEAILKRLDLRADAINQPMEEMSRGMQQKVAIARALLTAPILLLLDEPTTGLDPRSKREVQTLVRELRDTHDATIVLTTHDMNEADALCDRIAIVNDGKIVALDTPTGLKTLVKQNGHAPTLEDVFLQLTGKQLVTET
ncbi:ABC transporter ATP-binding protein NatA [Anaerolineae bacterium]|nr:ABC transporter ATP-binding protein NatA [Anaerolineae bacterium]